MKRSVPSIISILAGILLIVIGFRLELWVSILARVSREDFSVRLDWMASAYFADIFMVGLLLAWLWFTHHRVQRNRMVALIYVVLGAGLLIYTMVAFSSSPNIISFYVAPNSLTSFASAFMFVFGLQRLIFGQSAI